jgi:hypothetical protein
MGVIQNLVIIIQNKKENGFVVEKYLNNQFISVNERDLLNYFKENSIEADEYYHNQVLLLIGKMSYIAAPDRDGLYIVFNGYANSEIVIECYFTDFRISDIENGDIINIIGKYSNYNDENANRKKIIINNCKIIEEIN